MKLVKISFAIAATMMFVACGQEAATDTTTAATTAPQTEVPATTEGTAAEAAIGTTAAPSAGAEVAAPVTATTTTTKPATTTTPAAKPVQTGPLTAIKFTEMRHDFGKMKVGEKATHVFEFTNTGKEPLIITDAKGSCGCTVPKYPKAPIAPGKTEKITVEFSPKAGGKAAKDVTVTANTEPATTKLFITADVEAEEKK